jgi:Bacteriodetes cell division protein (FtsL-like)
MAEKKKKKTEEFVDSQQEKSELKITSFRDLISGAILTRTAVLRQLPFILFLVFMAIAYITNRYHAEKITRKTIELQEELNELRAQYTSTASELMFLSRQSQVLRLVEENNLGLKESRVPPKKIIRK